MPSVEAKNARAVGRQIADKHLTKPDVDTKAVRPLFQLSIVCPTCKTRVFHQERESPGMISTDNFNTCPTCNAVGLFVVASLFPETKR